MLKRLSYPLSWMEGLAGEAGGSSSSGSQAESVPTSADSHNSGSVFSKVFNRFVTCFINIIYNIKFTNFFVIKYIFGLTIWLNYDKIFLLNIMQLYK